MIDEKLAQLVSNELETACQISRDVMLTGGLLIPSIVAVGQVKMMAIMTKETNGAHGEIVDNVSTPDEFADQLKKKNV